MLLASPYFWTFVLSGLTGGIFGASVSILFRAPYWLQE